MNLLKQLWNLQAGVQISASGFPKGGLFKLCLKFVPAVKTQSDEVRSVGPHLCLSFVNVFYSAQNA